MLINYRLSNTPTPHESQPFESHRSSTKAAAMFDLYGRDDEFEDAESSLEAMLFSLPSQSEFDSFLPISSQSSSDNLVLSREVSIESRLSSLTNPSSRAFRIPAKAKGMMDSWIEANADDPYLKQGDAEALAHLTSLNPAQVRTYVGNARLRKPSAGECFQGLEMNYSLHRCSHHSTFSSELYAITPQLQLTRIPCATQRTKAVSGINDNIHIIIHNTPSRDM
jgi:hypothetical protein